MPWISLSSHTECIQCVQVPGVHSILSLLATPCPHPSIKLSPFSLHISLCSKFWLLSNRHHMVCKGGLYWVQMVHSTKCSWGHVKVHTSALRRWILRTLNTVSKRRRVLLDDCCVREQLPQVAITVSEEGAGSSNLESFLKPINKQLNSKTAETVQIQTGEYYWACSWLPPGLSCWTATGILLTQRFHIEHRSCWGSQ